MKTTLSVLTSTAALLAASTAQAHPGHDHGHWFSDINHALFYAAAAGVVAVAAMVFKAKRNARNAQNDKGDASK